ncbi:hypothetical protein WMY93_002458 [Mugilogobius chulae]|uniref:Ig-like domain-containing protein n=1 Tax=Mugilogobius chulae TaxID=88201 RepID=A0AAW0Q4I1_9GOBI
MERERERARKRDREGERGRRERERGREREGEKAERGVVVVERLLIQTSSLKLDPDSDQFFGGEDIRLSCESEWRVKRTRTGYDQVQSCGRRDGGFGRIGINDSSCFLYDLSPSDSGLYWCESAAGGRKTKERLLTVTGTAGRVKERVCDELQSFGMFQTQLCSKRTDTSVWLLQAWPAQRTRKVYLADHAPVTLTTPPAARWSLEKAAPPTGELESSLVSIQSAWASLSDS